MEDDQRNKYRILVAEDNQINQKVIIAVLNRSGYAYVLAKDGKQALEAYSKSKFDLILMDCQMPNIDGFEATKKIRDVENQGLSKRVPIVALTANAMKGDRENCLAAGMDDFLPKPFKSRELVEKIEGWVTKENGHE